MVCALAALSASTAAHADPQAAEISGSETIEQPVLVVLLAGGTAEVREREQRFVAEVGLALDGFDVATEEAGNVSFGSLSLPEQLDLIRPIAARPRVVAVTWLWERDSSYTMLHLVALSTGRALVRIVEAEQGPNTEVELALSTRELLGEAFLFAPPQEPGELGRIVGEAQDRVVRHLPAATAAGPEQDEGEPLRIGLMPFFTVGTGVLGHRGPSTLLGGGLAGELRPWAGLFLQLSVAGLAGPRADTRDGEIRSGGLAPRLASGYDWEIGPLMLGPIIEGSLRWSAIQMKLGSGDQQNFNRLRLRAGAGLDLRLRLGKNLALLAQTTVGVIGKRESFNRLSDGSTVLTTPLLDFQAIVGLMIH
jgi:hypothetical protein